jgi:hypothetical protein
MTQQTEKWDMSQFPIKEIKQAPENESIYDNFGVAKSDDWQLVQSIRDNGILEPLVITADRFLLSGHRRLAASNFIGLLTVPVRKHKDVFFSNLNTQERLDLLRLHNQQREKSPSEKIREAMVGLDPKVAHAELKIFNQRRKALDSATGEITIRGIKARAKITTLQFLAAAKAAIEKEREYWPLSVRRVHYLLLNDPPLCHDSKPDSKYVNNQNCYKKLTNLLARARLNGHVPIEAIEDVTRPVLEGGGFDTVGQYITQETQNFLTGYHRNLQQGQPHHVEIILEKNALRNVIERVAQEYCIPITTTRGYASIPPRYEVFRRYNQSGKPILILLCLTDFDPDGDEIAESFARSMRDDFSISNTQSFKVALRAEDVNEYDLPSDMDAKKTSVNYKKFFARYGTNRAVELDAAPVELLQEKLRAAIESVLDMDEFNAQIKQQELEALAIHARRIVVFNAIGNIAE